MIDLTWDGFGLTQPGNTAVIQATGIRCADSTYDRECGLEWRVSQLQYHA